MLALGTFPGCAVDGGGEYSGFAALPPGTNRVALSLSADLAEIARAIEQTRPDIIHVGAAVELFSVRETRALKTAFPDVRIMRAIPIVDEASIECANDYRGSPTFCCSTAMSPATDRSAGLAARTTGASAGALSRRVGVPVILAGGLDADNILAAISAVRPAGVDSKKTDRADRNGKDLDDKVRRFVAAAKLTTSRR